jgi:DNA-directed RNA polymerase
MTEQVCEVLKERGQATKGADLLARAIYAAIEGMVPSAKEVRDYLQQLAALCASEKKPLRWTTPLGLPVHSRYHVDWGR